MQKNSNVEEATHHRTSSGKIDLDLGFRLRLRIRVWAQGIVLGLGSGLCFRILIPA